MTVPHDPEDVPIVITGADGFIGKNLDVRLREAGYHSIHRITRNSSTDDIVRAISVASVIFNLAGSNRPDDRLEFEATNRGFVELLCEIIASGESRPLFVQASSTKAVDKGDYGSSKLHGERVLEAAAQKQNFRAAIYRLPNIFGKWARPNYNSAVATFCFNVARGTEIKVEDAAAPLCLLYIDDLIDQWLDLIADPPEGVARPEIERCHETTVGDVAQAIRQFADDRDKGLIGPVGTGLTRALYATFISNLPKTDFGYGMVPNVDPRGTFCELIKTENSGQFSYFTAHPGVTRGGHYHHTKTEKFMIVSGEALFRFRNILTDETHEIRTSGDDPVMVETIPGWAHDVTNVGEEKLIALLWANEVFNRARPDTLSATL